MVFTTTWWSIKNFIFKKSIHYFHFIFWVRIKHKTDLSELYLQTLKLNNTGKKMPLGNLGDFVVILCFNFQPFICPSWFLINLWILLLLSIILPTTAHFKLVYKLIIRHGKPSITENTINIIKALLKYFLFSQVHCILSTISTISIE